MSFGPFSALYFAFYEKLKENLVKPNEEISFVKSLLLSGLSGAVAGTITNPLDMAKLRMQIQRAERATGTAENFEGRFGYKNMFHGIQLIYKNEGIPSLFKGSITISNFNKMNYFTNTW